MLQNKNVVVRDS